jgi:putative methyltransferase (TIGR04325 family)
VLLSLGRINRLRSSHLRFRGAYASYSEAMAHVRPGKLPGYDHDSVTEVSRMWMEQVPVWDYPVLYWLRRLAPELGRIVDAGGHTGVKYKAFRPYLDLERVDWVVYDLPALVRAGRALAGPEDRTLSFVDRLEDAPESDLLLASGLMPYLDRPLTELVRRLRTPPRYIVLNKVATREGRLLVTLENFRIADVPYQIRPVGEVPAALDALGYDIVDEWVIDGLSHRIETHPELGRAAIRGYVARRRNG